MIRTSRIKVQCGGCGETLEQVGDGLVHAVIVFVRAHTGHYRIAGHSADESLFKLFGHRIGKEPVVGWEPPK